MAAGGEPWEASALGMLSGGSSHVLKRCVDLTDLLASATTGQVDVAVVSGELPGLDADAVMQLLRHDVRTVAVGGDEDTLTRIGVVAVVDAARSRLPSRGRLLRGHPGARRRSRACRGVRRDNRLSGPDHRGARPRRCSRAYDARDRPRRRARPPRTTDRARRRRSSRRSRGAAPRCARRGLRTARGGPARQRGHPGRGGLRTLSTRADRRLRGAHRAASARPMGRGPPRCSRRRARPRERGRRRRGGHRLQPRGRRRPQSQPVAQPAHPRRRRGRRPGRRGRLGGTDRAGPTGSHPRGAARGGRTRR